MPLMALTPTLREALRPKRLVSRLVLNRPIPHNAAAMPDARDERITADATFRLRFTRDVLGENFPVLFEVLERGAGGSARVLLVIDAGLDAADPRIAATLERRLAAHPDRVTFAGPTLRIPGGEACKDGLREVDRVLDAIHAAELDRWSYVLVLGGGAVLDAVGFAAATAHRGVRLVRLPTTTLAQADSGLGVKNAVNRYGKKNWLGTFAVPWAVINDTALRQTLPDREHRSGFAEAVKVALLKDPAFFADLCRDAKRIADRDPKACEAALRRSADLHLDHIARGGDPFEQHAARPLDFGHWSAHKLEAMTDFQLRHGEAVALGLAIDTRYAALRHGLPQPDADRVLQCLRDLQLPLTHPALHRPHELLQGLEEFRQHLGGRLTLTLLHQIGQPVEIHEIDQRAMLDAIREVSAL